MSFDRLLNMCLQWSALYFTIGWSFSLPMMTYSLTFLLISILHAAGIPVTHTDLRLRWLPLAKFWLYQWCITRIIFLYLWMLVCTSQPLLSVFCVFLFNKQTEMVALAEELEFLSGNISVMPFTFRCWFVCNVCVWEGCVSDVVMWARYNAEL